MAKIDWNKLGNAAVTITGGAMAPLAAAVWDGQNSDLRTGSGITHYPATNPPPPSEPHVTQFWTRHGMQRQVDPEVVPVGGKSFTVPLHITTQHHEIAALQQATRNQQQAINNVYQKLENINRGQTATVPIAAVVPVATQLAEMGEATTATFTGKFQNFKILPRQYPPRWWLARCLDIAVIAGAAVMVWWVMG